MSGFDYTGFAHPVRDDIAGAQRAAWVRIASTGAWWTAEQRVEIARLLREARAMRSEPPWLRGEAAFESGLLPDVVVDAVRRIGIDVHSLDRERVAAVVAEIGDAAYVEAVAVCVCTTAIDAFAESLGAALEPLPSPAGAGDAPARQRPEGVAEIGAYVPMTDPFPGPNVARALSLAPEDNGAFFGLVASMYAMADFGELVWKDRALARPEVELVASRVSAVNECFY